jgi:hypothetical protein
VAIAACGSSGKPSTAAASDGYAQGIKYADCMRSHGVPNFPDPTLSSPGSSPTLFLGVLDFPLGAGLNIRSPAFKQAATACGIPFP